MVRGESAFCISGLIRRAYRSRCDRPGHSGECCQPARNAPWFVHRLIVPNGGAPPYRGPDQGCRGARRNLSAGTLSADVRAAYRCLASNQRSALKMCTVERIVVNEALITAYQAASSPHSVPRAHVRPRGVRPLVPAPQPDCPAGDAGNRSRLSRRAGGAGGQAGVARPVQGVDRQGPPTARSRIRRRPRW